MGVNELLLFSKATGVRSREVWKIMYQKRDPHPLVKSLRSSYANELFLSEIDSKTRPSIRKREEELNVDLVDIIFFSLDYDAQ